MSQEVLQEQQIPLGSVVRDAFGKAGDQLLVVLRDALAGQGKQGDDLAVDLGVDPGQLSRALHGRGAHFSLRWLPAALYRDRSRELICHLCRLAGGDFVERPELTPEQELAALKHVLQEAGPVGEAILRAARGERP